MTRINKTSEVFSDCFQYYWPMERYGNHGNLILLTAKAKTKEMPYKLYVIFSTAYGLHADMMCVCVCVCCALCNEDKPNTGFTVSSFNFV